MCWWATPAIKTGHHLPGCHAWAEGHKVESFLMSDAGKFEYNPFGLRSCTVVYIYCMGLQCPTQDMVLCHKFPSY